MANKRRKLILLGLGLVTVGSLLCGWLMIPRHHVNPDSYEAIHDGMTLEQVQQVIGGPPGQYFHGAIRYTRPAAIGTTAFTGDRLIPEDACEDVLVGGENDELRLVQRCLWIGDAYGIGVFFENGKVVSKEQYEVDAVDEPWYAKVRRWLPW